MKARFCGRLPGEASRCSLTRMVALKSACLLIVSVVLFATAGCVSGGMATVDPPALQIDDGPPTPPVHSVVGDLSSVNADCLTIDRKTECRIEPSATVPKQEADQPTNVPSATQSAAHTEWKLDIWSRSSSDKLIYGISLSQQSGPVLNLNPRTISLPYVRESKNTYTVTGPDLNPLRITADTPDALSKIAFNEFMRKLRSGKPTPTSPDVTITQSEDDSYTFAAAGFGPVTMNRQPDGSYAGLLGTQYQHAYFRKGQWFFKVGGKSGSEMANSYMQPPWSAVGWNNTFLGLGRYSKNPITAALSYLDECDYYAYYGYWDDYYRYCSHKEEVRALTFLAVATAFGWRPDSETAYWLQRVSCDVEQEGWYASPSEAWYGEGPYYYFDKPRLFGTGAVPNKYSVGGPGLFVSDPEFVQQYVLVTNQFGPEYGRSASFVVNQITGSAISPPFHGFDFVSRSDWQLGSDTITGRYLFNRGSTFSSDFGATTGYLFNVPVLSQAVLQNWTHNLSGHMVNEARVSFNRLNVNFGGNDQTAAPSWSFPLVQPITPATGSSNRAYDFGAELGGPIVRDKLWFWGSWGKQDIRINNPISTSVVPSSRIVNTWQAQDNWNYVLGKHQLKAGVNWTYQRSPTVFLPSINSSWPSLPGSGNIPQLDFREYDTFLYAGDDWKIGQNLTLNLGLTYSYYGQPAKPSGESAGVTPPFTPYIESGIVIGGQFYGQHVDLPTSPQRGSANGFGAPSAFLGPDKVNAWSFGFERELTKSSAIEARYVGNRAYDLFPSIQPGGASAGVDFQPGYKTAYDPRSFNVLPYLFGRTESGFGGGGWRLEVGLPYKYSPWLGFGSTKTTGAGVTAGSGSTMIASLGTNIPGTLALSSTASLAIPAGWRVRTLEEFREQLGISAKKSPTGENSKTSGKILGPNDLELRVDAEGRVILSRGPWELATLNAAPPFGLESGTAAWMAAPLPADLPQQISYSLVANGNSAGEAFELQVMDPSGQFKRVVLPDGVVLEPAAKKSPQAKAASEIAGQVGNVLKQEITSFCLQFAKLPPEAGMLYKIADPEKQRQYRPAAYVLEAGYELGANGELNPDSDPKAYIDAIRQYAVWAEQEGWDEQQFTEHWIERTKKNAQAMNIAWSQQMEDALRAAAPNRWRDITKVRNKPKSMMQSESSPAR